VAKSLLTHDCEYCFALKRAIERPARKMFRSMRFGARALDELRFESMLPPEELMLSLPPIACDPLGYERQVLADLQIGLMALASEGPSEGREALVGIRDSA